MSDVPLVSVGVLGATGLMCLVWVVMFPRHSFFVCRHRRDSRAEFVPSSLEIASLPCCGCWRIKRVC